MVTGASLTIGKDFYLDWRNRSRLGAYAAIRIVCVLDLFADDCLQVAQDQGEYHVEDHGQEERSFTATAPSSPAYPSDIDWKSLDPTLVYKSQSKNIMLCGRAFAASGEQTPSGGKREHFG